MSTLLSRVLKLLRKLPEKTTVQGSAGMTATVIPRNAHPISRNQISPNALKVLYRLHKAGYDAYLVGGGVRDLLMGVEPKDFDITTNATPEEIKALFRNCRLIGRRFRLAHILFGRDVIEVATMRGHHEQSNQGSDHVSRQSDAGMLLRDNVYGSIEEDAERRDFSVNALYYNIADYSLLDFAGGIEAIAQRKLKMIGDPATRYREDPVRMLRAVRFATKLGMSISEETLAPIPKHAHLLADIPAPRLFDECCKLFLNGKAEANFAMMRELGLLQVIFPHVTEHLSNDPEAKDELFIRLALQSTDQRVANEQGVTPAFLFASVFWPLQEQVTQKTMLESGLSYHEAFQVAASDVLEQKQVAIPKRFTLIIREIWQLQLRFPKRFGKRAERLATHPKFRAAYDFLLIRGQAGHSQSAELARWWSSYIQAPHNERQRLVSSLKTGGKRRNPSRRRRPSAAKQK